MFTPRTLEVVMVSFEGPDQYSQAGGLGVRARELCRAMAARNCAAIQAASCGQSISRLRHAGSVNMSQRMFRSAPGSRPKSQTSAASARFQATTS